MKMPHEWGLPGGSLEKAERAALMRLKEANLEQDALRSMVMRRISFRETAEEAGAGEGCSPQDNLLISVISVAGADLDMLRFKEQITLPSTFATEFITDPDKSREIRISENCSCFIYILHGMDLACSVVHFFLLCTPYKQSQMKK